jgi:excisionase family DNA binding protein
MTKTNLFASSENITSNWPNNMTNPYFPRASTYTTGAAARVLNVSLRTVQLWVADGKLQSCTTPGGHRRIGHAALAELAKSMGCKMPSDMVPHSPVGAATLTIGSDGSQSVELLGAAGLLPAGVYTLFLSGVDA